jgi:hypothetical protein
MIHERAFKQSRTVLIRSQVQLVGGGKLDLERDSVEFSFNERLLSEERGSFVFYFSRKDVPELACEYKLSPKGMDEIRAIQRRHKAQIETAPGKHEEPAPEPILGPMTGLVGPWSPSASPLQKTVDKVLHFQTMVDLIRSLNHPDFGKLIRMEGPTNRFVSPLRGEGQQPETYQHKLVESLGRLYQSLRRDVRTHRGGPELIRQLLRSGNSERVNLGLTLVQDFLRGPLQVDLECTVKDETLPTSLRRLAFALLYPERQRALRDAGPRCVPAAPRELSAATSGGAGGATPSTAVRASPIMG